MPWPSMSDYQEAIQNPKSCFSDPELRNGVPTTDRLGLPKPVTGGFASVYEMKFGGHKYAVRCFLHHIADLEQRYSIIGNYLNQVHLKYMVDFEFINRGIMVRSQWFPILKMEWIDGDQLNIYIEKNLGDPPALLSLAEQFAQMVADLRRNSIAHGDLQHGNILVRNGNMRLIDYDGMYVPGLKGMPSEELGHKNYQHPNRTVNDFGPNLDNFSAWVIYSSLVILSIDPTIWDVAEPDESLLFRSSDFKNPAKSRILSVLDKNPDKQIRSLAATLRSLFSIPDPAKIPPLKPLSGVHVAKKAAPPPKPPPSKGNRPSGSPNVSEDIILIPDWRTIYASLSLRRLVIGLFLLFAFLLSLPLLLGLLCLHPQIFAVIVMGLIVFWYLWAQIHARSK